MNTKNVNSMRGFRLKSFVGRGFSRDIKAANKKGLQPLKYSSSLHDEEGA
jgi:hypothetical protein